MPNKGWRSVRVARLVALAYIPNPDGLSDVNHKNYDRSDSNVENLEWTSHINNVRYSNCNRPNYNGKNNPNYGNKKLSEEYKNNPQYAIEKQSRPGIQNGRCRRVEITLPNGEALNFGYIGECAKYLIDHGYVESNSVDSVRSSIIKATKRSGKYRNCSIKLL